jgi:murein DD-endopeptidase MepM/ murein hydrolase activator NlpD
MSNKCVRTAFARRRAAQGLVIAMTVSAGGCSADVTRFDFPAFALTNSGAVPATGSLAPPPQPLARSYQSSDLPPPTVSLPSEVSGGGSGGSAYAGPGEATASARGYGEPAPKVAVASPNDRFTARHIDRVQVAGAQAGPTIIVQPGDTLYVLAKRHAVPISAIIELNGLRSGSSLHPGQRITLPAGARHVREAERAPEPAAAAPTPTLSPAPAASAAAPGGWEGEHTVKAGESLYGIARQYKVGLAELQRINAITEPTKVRVGTVLRVPGRAQAAASPRFVPTSSSGGPPAKSRLINAPVEQEQQPAPERRVASLADRATDAGPADASSGKFRWPVRGRIIAGYGKRPDGTHNDGINLAVPQGTEIHAVEGGKVAYAGNELKGYGNLVLIRHDNGWVSAYAHAEQLLVKRDDVVRRGQVIAKAGRTGTVDQPQLHFELRHGAKPVDPLPHLEGG